MKFFKTFDKKMEYKAVAEKMQMEPEQMAKVRCYNCGKVFHQKQTNAYQRMLRINTVLKEIDEQRLSQNKYSPNDFKILVQRIRMKASMEREEFLDDYRFSTLLRELFQYADAQNWKKVKDILKTLVDEYLLKPFDILKETSEENMDTPFQNNNERILNEMGVRKICCKMHFQTPYILSQGLTNFDSAMFPGLRNQQNTTRASIKEIQDPMTYMENGNILHEGGRGKTSVNTGGKKATRKKKSKEQFMTVQEAKTIPSVQIPAERREMEREEKEEEWRNMAQMEAMDIQMFMQETLDFGEVEDVDIEYEPIEKEFGFTVEPNKGIEKYGRLNIPVEKKELKKRRGRGRPKKEGE